MKIISLFNHKGGVSKTTTTFNLGWMLADLGHKVLIVDADPQCNLTALVLGYTSIDDAEEFYTANPQSDLYSGIEPILNGALQKLSPAVPLLTANANLSLLCGNIELSEAETQISVALSTSAKLRAMQNIPGSIGSFIRETGNSLSFDYVLVDMSPSVGALNECLLMASDYFIVPTAPDFFCAQAIKSLTKVIPRWKEEIKPFTDASMVYPLPDSPPKFIGFISQKYRPRNNAPAKSFKRWIDIINNEVENGLVPALTPLNMSISEDQFKESVASESPFNLANISDFNSLIAKSQQHNVPVFHLTDEQLEQSGKVEENMIKSRDSFKEAFRNLAEAVVNLTS